MVPAIAAAAASVPTANRTPSGTRSKASTIRSSHARTGATYAARLRTPPDRRGRGCGRRFPPGPATGFSSGERLDVLGLDARAHADQVDHTEAEHGARDGVEGGRQVGLADALTERDLGDRPAHHRAGRAAHEGAD